MRLAVIVLTLSAILSPSEALAKGNLHPHQGLWHWYRASGARCVVSREGSWTSNTGNGYYGAFQMDRAFMQRWNPRRYANHGTADHWTATHQVATARRAVRSIGWGPWPLTARMCGLL